MFDKWQMIPVLDDADRVLDDVLARIERGEREQLRQDVSSGPER